ncbi:MAG: 50S ribosomal protein L4 [Candidatus Woesearchaeota archaeon]
MEATILKINNQEAGKKKLPKQFEEVVRPDLIKRAVMSIISRKRQAYGSKPEAGQRASAKLSRRRRDYKGSYGLGISRVPRKILSRRGTRMNWVGAVSPGTVGGRRAHPPKSGKDWEQKINRKENQKAIRSCLAASVSKQWVEKKPATFPFIAEKQLEQITETKTLKQALNAYGIEYDFERNIRVGKAKARGRKYKSGRGTLIVVSGQCPLIRSAANLKGIEVCDIHKINAELLAPGAKPGRLTIYTEASIEALEKEKLYES